MFEGPKRSESLRRRLNTVAARKGPGHLHCLLNRVDPASAKRIAANDKPKTLRALEVYFLTATPLSQHWLNSRDPLRGFDILKVGLRPAARPPLPAHRSSRRGDVCEWVVDRGRVSSRSRVQRTAQAASIAGLRSVCSLSEGRADPGEAISSTQLETRRYAKRQLTWFRRERNLFWFDGFGSQPETQSVVKACVQKFLRDSWTVGGLPCGLQAPPTVVEFDTRART